jgi:hypothetical protein
MRGFYWFQRKKIITIANSEISYSPTNLACTTLLFPHNFFGPTFFGLAFSALQNHLSSSGKFALLLSQITLLMTKSLTL